MAGFSRAGVWIDHVDGAGDRPPLVFVHGGGHASWCWTNLLAHYVAARWECVSFDWYGHGRSAGLPPDVFLRRSIGDVAEEVGVAAEVVGRPPVLVGHSMGAAACLAYAATHPVAGLVLLTPVVPAGLGAVPLDLPVDLDRLFGPPSLPQARAMFFPGLADDAARRYWELLCPESPVAVQEATRWELALDLARIDTAALVIAGERDVLCPPATVRLLARAINADYLELADCGHDDVLLADGCWPATATAIDIWLRADVR